MKMENLVYFVVLTSVLNVVVAEEILREKSGKCERITLPLCQDLGYNWTVMPNLMGNADQKEAEQAMAVYSGLLASKCSPHAGFLLCSGFAPLCSEEVPTAVGGCRALCEQVNKDCAGALSLLNAETSLDCSKFPERNVKTLCMRPPNATESMQPPHWTHPEVDPPFQWTYPQIDSSHWSYPEVDATRDCPPSYTRSSTGECAPACGRDVQFKPEEKRKAEIWITAAAWMSLLSTAFAALTFCADPSRFRYPERPVVFLASCHMIVALTYITRSWLGARTFICAGQTLAVDGLASTPCVTFFSFAYYFTLAADAWFLNACIAWYLTAASEWSTEALERAGAYFHAAAWGWAGGWTAAALALRKIAADELTGTCGIADGSAAALVGIPRGTLLVAAAGLALGAWPGVRRVRKALDPRGSRRVGRLAARAAAAGALYWALAALGTSARVAGGPGSASAALWLAGGAAAGAWAWSRKSATVWARALCPPKKTPCCRPPPLLRTAPPYVKRPMPISIV